jgi:hypothetical protein
MEIPDQEFQAVIRRFKGEFSTYDAILHLQKLFPKTWKALENEYGVGGKGAGSH